MYRSLRERLTALGVSTSRPAAFVVFGLYAAAWVAFDRESLNWPSRPGS